LYVFNFGIVFDVLQEIFVFLVLADHTLDERLTLWFNVAVSSFDLGEQPLRKLIIEASDSILPIHHE
jgi:hypothetical protein